MALLCTASILLRSAVNPMVFAKCRFAMEALSRSNLPSFISDFHSIGTRIISREGSSVDFFRFSVGGK